MTQGTFQNLPHQPNITHLSVPKVIIALCLILAPIAGLAYWVITQRGITTVGEIEATQNFPAWMRQANTYPEPKKAETTPPPVSIPVHDKYAEQIAELMRQLRMQQLEIDLLKRRSTQTASTQAPPPPKAPSPPQYRSSYFVNRTVPSEKEKVEGEYTLAPGATKLPCVIETAMNSDVPGYFTAKVSQNVYDTATHRKLLVPQGSTILGKYDSGELLFGNERLPTISLSLALPNGKTVDIGNAPVTDQQGIAGLTGKVNQHYWRLLSAVFIGGALRGGAQYLQVASGTTGPGIIAGGIAQTGGNAVQQRIGRALDSRPTIEIESGQLCNVILLKELNLTAQWGS